MLFEFSFYPRYTLPLLLVRDYEYYGIPTPLKFFFFFQILILSCEPFISLPFFPDNRGPQHTYFEFDRQNMVCV